MICIINAALYAYMYTLLLLATSARYEYEVLWYWYSSRSWAFSSSMLRVRQRSKISWLDTSATQQKGDGDLITHWVGLFHFLPLI